MLPSAVRVVLPKLLDQYQLLGRELGKKPGDDAWLTQLAQVVFSGTHEQAADAVAQSLAEGFSPESIGEALSLAANKLVLHDPGRPEKWANADKPAGSVHGDSVGVHASDAANALAQHCAREQRPQYRGQSDRGCFPHGGQAERSNKDPYPLPNS